MTTLGLKNVNLLSKEQYNEIAEPVKDELYAISGSGFGFPSSNYEDLELGASGTKYTAPANGYFHINKVSSSTNQYIDMKIEGKYGVVSQPNPTSSTLKMLLPVQKGDVVTINYNVAGTTNAFRFIYAEGE